MFKILIAFLVTVLNPSALFATPFDQGSVSYSALISSGRAFNNDYTVLGLGIGYYLLDGLQVGVDYEYWSGGRPTIQQIGSRINYVFTRQQQFSPYIGFFYRKTKVNNTPDSSARGGRAGTYIKSGENITLGFGVAYIEYDNCQLSIYDSCSDTYPEFTVGASF